MVVTRSDPVQDKKPADARAARCDSASMLNRGECPYAIAYRVRRVSPIAVRHSDASGRSRQAAWFVVCKRNSPCALTTTSD
jgi:hypothetical protein